VRATARRATTRRSHPPLDRPDLLGLVIEPHEGVVHKAPAPAFRRVVAFDDRLRRSGQITTIGLSHRSANIR